MSGMLYYSPVSLTITPTRWSDLRPHPANPRNGDIDAIKESVRTNGVYRPIIATQDGTILAGHHLYHALGELGHDTVDVVLLPLDPNSAEARRIMVADNRTADLGRYDESVLLDLLDSLPDLDGTGYTDRDLGELRDALTRVTDRWDTPTPPLPKTPVTQVGDLWRLGEHVVYCADSTEPETFVTALGGRTIDLVITDPPYGVIYEDTLAGKSSSSRAKRNIDGDGGNGVVLLVITLAAMKPPPGTPFYSFTPSGPDLADFIRAVPVRQVLVWVKDRFVLGRSHYHYQHEAILYGWVKGAACRHEPPDRKQSSVWNAATPSRNKDHPTEKPVALYETAILNGSDPGQTVVDPFAGSGPVVIAAQNTGRVAVAVEIDPAYCDVICRRWQEMTGQKPERDGQPYDFTEAEHGE